MVIVAEHHTKIITTIIGLLFLLTISVYSDSGLNSTDEYYAALDKENNNNIITTRSIMFNKVTNGTEMASQLTRDKRSSSMNVMNVGVVRRVHRSVSRQLTIELSVFVDYDMQIHYHYTRQNMHKYIETVLYIVAGIFRDSSVGNSIDVALVEIVQLNVELNAQTIKQSPSSSSSSNDVEGRRENVNATDLLTKFCRWQSEHRSQYAKYDTAILLTRKDLCSSSTTIEGFGCSTSGLANIGTICSQKGTSCAVIQDEGLGTAFTIAHEIGHLLSLRHDNDEECLKKKSMKESANGFFIMNSVLGTDSNAWGWSQCSRDQLTKFLDSGSGQCLENPPQSPLKSFLADRDDRNLEKLKLPGLVYSAVEQCQLAMGLSTPGASKPCHGGKVFNCRSMRCSREFRGQNGQVLESCRILPKPWADGTECSVSDDDADDPNINQKEKWCIRGKCVRKMNNEDLKVVHGDWSSFSEPGPCSRTCNGGIRARVRQCNNPKPKNGGRYCVGERAQYESCNTHSCGDCFSEFQFRAKQCRNYNGNNFNYPDISKNVAWVPFTNAQGNDRCKLLCIDEKTRFYHFLDRMNVIDGTKCSSVNPDAENFDMCVNGICVPAGCDHILHSTKKLDICGVCGGDNSTCTLVKGNFTNASVGTRDVVRIPAGAFSIKISQRSSIQKGTLNILPVDNNHLILFSPEDNKTLLNNPTDPIIQYRKIITDLGSTFNYSGIGSYVESITTPSSPRRSINSDLIIRVHSYRQFQLSNPNIMYQFYVSKSGVQKNFVCSPDAASPLLSCLYDSIKYFYLLYFLHVLLNF